MMDSETPLTLSYNQQGEAGTSQYIYKIYQGIKM